MSFRLVATICLPLMLATASNAMSLPECYSPSPHLKSGGDQYYSADNPIPLSQTDQSKLKELSRSLLKKWRGKLTSVVCKGPDNSPQRLISSMKVDVKIIIRDDYLSAVEVDRNRKKSIISVLDKNHIFKLQPTHNSIEAATKYRYSIGTGSKLTEVLLQLFKTKTTLKLVISEYSNGYFLLGHSLDLSI